MDGNIMANETIISEYLLENRRIIFPLVTSHGVNVVAYGWL